MNDTSKDGGPAYPIPNLESDADFNGMSLRDWFAGQALPAMVAKAKGPTATKNSAHKAYAIADEMIKARKENRHVR